MDGRTRAVVPVSRPEPLARPGEGTDNQKHPSRVPPQHREMLASRYHETSVERVATHADGRRAAKAVTAYASVSLVDQREVVSDMLGVSLYA